MSLNSNWKLYLVGVHLWANFTPLNGITIIVEGNASSMKSKVSCVVNWRAPFKLAKPVNPDITLLDCGIVGIPY